MNFHKKSQSSNIKDDKTKVKPITFISGKGIFRIMVNLRGVFKIKINLNHYSMKYKTKAFNGVFSILNKILKKYS